ncbi:MAG: hypothetical protein HZA13_05425 [Nitrospirae bacterium]|nr:hypothetical protein [Nitrospirota bacterium]
MAIKINYMVKVVDAKMTDLKKALEAGGIKVSSVIEMYKEEEKETEANSSSQ